MEHLYDGGAPFVTASTNSFQPAWAAYNWQVPSDRHDVRSLDAARLAHFTHCGKPPSKINGRYDACGLLHREWRETWARVAAESGVVGEG